MGEGCLWDLRTCAFVVAGVVCVPWCMYFGEGTGISVDVLYR